MLESVISLASYGLGTGGTAGNILFQLEQQGVFAYVLPFLMIFAILFGILEKIKIFGDNKGINVILSMAVSLMALQMNFVSYFFREIFPRMGILLSIMLVAMISIGMFWGFDKKWVKFIFGGIVAIGVIVIVFQSFGDLWMFGSGMGSSWRITYWLQNNLGLVLTLILIVVGFIAVVKGGSKKEEKSKKKVDWDKLMSNVVYDKN